MQSTPIKTIKLGSLGALGLWLISVFIPLAASAGTYTLFTTQVPFPADLWQDYPNGVLGTRFHSEVPGRITALRYYAQAGDNDETTLKLWDYTTQAELASVTGTPSSAEGWFQLSLAAPVHIEAGKDYVVTYNAGANGNYIGEGGFFNTRLVNGPLTAPVGAGIFADSGFPIQPPYGNTSYYADVVFEDEIVAGFRVLGNQNGSGFRTIPSGQLTGSRFTALRSIRLSSINIRILRMASATGDSVLKCAIYSEFGNGVAELLGGTAELVNPTNGWYSLPLTQPVSVGATSNYWLVVWGNADEITLCADPTGQRQFYTYAYSSDWPPTAFLIEGPTTGMFCLYAEGLPTGVTGPEMEVQGNRTWIQAGSTTPSYANGSDLGGKTLGTGSLVQTYTIINAGQSSLSLSGTPPVTITGPQAGDFVVSTPPASSVAAGASTTFTISYTPSAVGVSQATVSILHADSSGAPYQFAIQAEGLYPGTGVLGYDGLGVDSRFIYETTVSGNRFVAPGDLRITELHAKVVGMAGTYSAAVYGDNDGVAGALLATATPVSNPPNGWNTFVLAPPVNVTGGKFYWLMVWGDSPAAALSADLVGTTYQGNYNYLNLSGQWPDPVFLNPIGESRTWCIYAEGAPLTAPTGAAMDVRGSGKLIMPGDVSPEPLDGTDFGSLALGSAHLDHLFTIQNAGSATLTLTGNPRVSVTGAQAGDFQIISAPAASVPAGGSTPFTVRFTPAKSGLRTAVINVANNDLNPAKNPYQFAVQGAGFIAGRESLFPENPGVVGDAWDNVFYELGTIFQASVPGTVTQIRVYSVPGDNGDHSCRIWDTLAQTVVAGPYIWNFGGVNGWVYLDIPPLTIQANSQYTVAIATTEISHQDYANQVGTLLTAGDNGLNLSYPASAGVFDQSGVRGVMPMDSWNGSSYLRDIVFVPSSSTTAFADVQVLGNGNLIPDGYYSAASSNLTDFGSAPVGGAVQQTFVITNLGTAPLNLTGSPKVQFAGPQAADFSVVTQLPASVAPGSASPVTIRFSPGALGTRRAIVAIPNDEKNPYYFSIAGTGIPPFKIKSVTTEASSGSVTLQWDGPDNQQFQVMRALSLTGGFSPIGQPQTAKSYTDVGILLTNAHAFYQISY